MDPMMAGVGLALGIAHAAEPDHIAAMGVIAERAGTVRRAAALGALWGCGHSITVLLAGAALVALGIELPEILITAAKWAVALWLLGLGALALSRDDPARVSETAGRPLGLSAVAIGVTHGLAGSAAGTLLAIAATDEPSTALAVLGLFGLGTVLGMAAVSGLLTVPMGLARRDRARRVWIPRAVGAASAAMGVWLIIGG